MEVKEWSYEEYPSFDMPVDGVTRIPTSGDEKGTYIYSNVEYAHINGTTLHLQVITPQTRNTKKVMRYILVSCMFRGRRG